MAVKEITMTKMPINAPVARLVRGDNESTVLRMKVDRFDGGVDLADLSWMVNVVNAEGVFDAYPLQNVAVEADTISVEWLIGGVATRTEGDTQFELEGVRDGDTAIVWQSGSRVLKIYPDVSGLPQDVEEEELSEVAQLIEYVNTELPSVLSARDEAVGAAQHPPVVGENGNWFTWDAASAAYVDSGKPSQGEPGETGPQGPKGDKGVKGDTGPRGFKGEKGDKGDTGEIGPQGKKGEAGPAGADGLTPHIGDNGHWYIGDTDTGILSRGEDGASGNDGQSGKDGISPVISVSDISNGHRITITDANGTKTVDIMDGTDGRDGSDGQDGSNGSDGATGNGISNVAKTSTSGLVDTYTITYTNGNKTTFTVTNGNDGADGSDGANGVSATHSWNGTVLTITSASGSSSADLKGEKGDKGDTGPAGPAGADGDSVTIGSVSESAEDGGENVVTFSTGETLTVRNGKKGINWRGEWDESEVYSDGDAVTYNGSAYYLVVGRSAGSIPDGISPDDAPDSWQLLVAKGADGAAGQPGSNGNPGQDGYTPVKGVDYWTDADKEEILAELSADSSWLGGYDIPKLYLTGDTTGMTKENAVTLGWKYGENSGSCTLKWQGSSSLSYDKKNYTIKLDTAIDIGYGAQKKYCLKANYIDFSHARNIVSARIWGMMVASRSNVNATLAASPNYGAINGFPVAIVLNGEFHGLYTINIPKDGWMMNMGSGTQECILCAQHSTAAQFKGEATLEGETDLELEYITDEANTAWAVTSVNRLINACINSNGSDLDTTIAQYLDWESAIDYYILVALLDGQDMLDKNYILATYDGVKWFFSAYDMDSTYGLKWNATYFSRAGYGDQTSFVAYANKHRAMELIKRFKTDALKTRYAELRADVLSEDNIAREFERFACSLPSRVLDEDTKVWPMLPLTAVNNTFQILCWLNRRLAYVDKWMSELPAQETPALPSYTNQVPISTDASGAIFNGTGYMDGYRLSDDWTGKAAEGYTCTGLIPCKGSDTIRIKGVQWPQTDAVGCYVSLYDASKNILVRVRANNTTTWLTPTYDDSTGIITMCLINNEHAGSMAYVRFSCIGNGADMIVTVNEEIEL